MPSISFNLITNLIGRIYSAGIAILLIPVYIKYLGIESYGLIGFYTTLMGALAVLDFGLGFTLNRELAKYNFAKEAPDNIRNLTLTLEVIYCIIGLLMSILIILFSGKISTHWLKIENLNLKTAQQSIILMGLVLAFQWPIGLYSGGLTGLQQQVLNNFINVIMSTIRAVGVLIVLKYFSATVISFFLWQCTISLLFVIVMRFALWSKIPGKKIKPRFSINQIKNIYRFALGMTGISFISFFISQIDKVILSKLLKLSFFGYYTLAFTIASSIGLVATPISITFFPRFTNLIASHKNKELILTYHNACKLMSSLVFPFSFILLFFIQDILNILTNNSTTTTQAYPLAQILIIGSIFNALMVMPYNLLLSYGWTKFTIYQNTLAAIVLVPLLFYWTNAYGAKGATFVWLIVNAGYFIVSQPLMHRKILKNELKEWYIMDVFQPMIPSLAFILLLKFLLIHYFPNYHLSLFSIAIISIISLLLSILNLSQVRIYIVKFYKKKYNISSSIK